MSFFNTATLFSSPVGQMIEAATDSNSSDEHLELYFEICDLINTKEEHAKEAIKVIKKKINLYAGKNWLTVMKLLKLLEISSANCNRKFQVQLANKDFLQELKNIVGPKLQPPLSIQEKVLFLIQHWANSFKNDSDFKPIEAFYTELRTKGIDFPIADNQSIYSSANNDSKLEKQIPPELKSVLNSNDSAGASSSATATAAAAGNLGQASTVTSPRQQAVGYQPPVPGSAVGYQPPVPGSAVRLNEEQMAKLQSELDVVDNNVLVMNELLTEIQTADKITLQSSETQKDIVLLKEIYRTTQEMQKRITQLIGNISNENIIGDLLRINDDLNNSFVRYERFEKTFHPVNSNQNSVSLSQNTMATKKTEEKSLIDFDAEDIPSNGVIPNSLKPSLLEKSAAGPPLPPMNKKKEMPDDDDDGDINQFLQDENEIKEMENWLKTQGASVPENQTK